MPQQKIALRQEDDKRHERLPGGGSAGADPPTLKLRRTCPTASDMDMDMDMDKEGWGETDRI